MKIYKIKSHQFKYLSVTTGLGFLLYILTTPFLYNQDNGIMTTRNLPRNFDKQSLPITVEERNVFLTSAETENEYGADTASYHIQNRNQQESRQLPNLMSYVFAVMFVGFCILIRKSRYLLSEVKHQVCLLAISMGGHAPPAIKVI